jgi:hypothetical protein
VPKSRFSRPVALLLALCLVAPLAASAKGRDYAGRVVSIDAGQIVVESRQGGSQSFVRGESTRVRGRDAWSAIRPGDEVVVRWRLRDGPSEALRVIVLPAD